MIESNFKKDLEQKIDRYINGELNEEQVDELWVELIQDEYYLDYVKSVANIKAVIEKNRALEQQAPVRTLRQYASYGIAAAIAIIIGVIGVMNFSANNELNSVSPLQTLGYDGIRGSEDNVAASESEIIKEAIQLVNQGDMEEAIALLQAELTEVDSPVLVAEISLTLGSIQYNFGDYDAALESFERVVAQNDVSDLTLEKGYWYLGNTFFQLDRLNEAEVAFQNAYELNGAYSRVTKSYLDALQSAR